MRAKLGVEQDDSSEIAPWPSELDVGRAGIGGEARDAEDEEAILRVVVLALAGDEASAGVRGGVDLAVVKVGYAIAEDEVDVAGDVALVDECAADFSGASRGLTASL